MSESLTADFTLATESVIFCYEILLHNYIFLTQPDRKLMYDSILL